MRGRRGWEAWLAENHERHEGVWIKIAKKGAGVPSVTNDEAVDGGLIWGWISGHRKALDETYFLQRYTPRRPGSNWSAVNVAKVEALDRDRSHAATRAGRGRRGQGRRSLGPGRGLTGGEADRQGADVRPAGAGGSGSPRGHPT